MSDIVNGAKSIRMALQYFLSVLSDSVQDDDSRIRVSGLYEPWTAGKYEAGDIRNAEDQPWECFQSHDCAIYPDIKPGSAAWFTFWRPLHGKTPETARPFVPVQGARHVSRRGIHGLDGWQHQARHAGHRLQPGGLPAGVGGR